MPRVSSDTMGAPAIRGVACAVVTVVAGTGDATVRERPGGGARAGWRWRPRPVDLRRADPGAAARVKPMRGNGLESTALGLIWGQGARPAFRIDAAPLRATGPAGQ
jgi:hypothetical protein